MEAAAVGSKRQSLIGSIPTYFVHFVRPFRSTGWPSSDNQCSCRKRRVRASWFISRYQRVAACSTSPRKALPSEVRPSHKEEKEYLCHPAFARVEHRLTEESQPVARFLDAFKVRMPPTTALSHDRRQKVFPAVVETTVTAWTDRDRPSTDADDRQRQDR